MKLNISNHGSKLFIRSTIIIFLSLFMLLIQGCGQMPTADLQNLQLPTTSNYYLICPKGYCNVEPSEYSPVYNVSAEDLFNAWNQLVAKQLYMNITGTIPEKAQYEYVQRSPVLGFPDYITVQFIAISDYSSTLAIYSRSRYGFYDFNVNKKRVKNFITQLNQVVANLPPSNPSATAAASGNEEDNANVKNLNNLVVPNIPSISTSTDNTNGTTTGGTSTDNTSGTTTGGTSTDNTSGNTTS